MITKESTLADVCCAVSAALESHGMSAILTGGSAAALYAPQSYLSYDADFILEADDPLDDVVAALRARGSNGTTSAVRGLALPCSLLSLEQ
ncbi:MAG: hypothetical protein WAJ85_00735 [Candidatus Baltobacteraceae bacterium]|jgi:hypothetical protein